MQNTEVVKTVKTIETGHQERLENAILHYQKILATGNARMIDNAYKNVCSGNKGEKNLSNCKNNVILLLTKNWSN